MTKHQNTQPDFGTGEKTLEIYVTGFITCAVLTLIPFGAVMVRVLSQPTTVGLVVACALAQLIVQLICFLRMNYHTRQAKTNVKSFAFTLFMVFVLIVGSIWIMSSLSYNMMH